MSESATPQHWSASVERDGENIVTIESNCLSGRDISAEDAETIRTAARHLLSFVGERQASDARPTDLAEGKAIGSATKESESK